MMKVKLMPPTLSDPPVEEELKAEVKNNFLEVSKVDDTFDPNRGIP